jgi:hypothetical protein
MVDMNIVYRERSSIAIHRTSVESIQTQSKKKGRLNSSGIPNGLTPIMIKICYFVLYPFLDFLLKVNTKQACY